MVTGNMKDNKFLVVLEWMIQTSDEHRAAFLMTQLLQLSREMLCFGTFRSLRRKKAHCALNTRRG